MPMPLSFDTTNDPVFYRGYSSVCWFLGGVEEYIQWQLLVYLLVITEELGEKLLEIKLGERQQSSVDTSTYFPRGIALLDTCYAFRGQYEDNSLIITLSCWISTVCPRSSYSFYIVSYYIKWVNTFLTYSRSWEKYSQAYKHIFHYDLSIYVRQFYDMVNKTFVWSSQNVHFLNCTSLQWELSMM